MALVRCVTEMGMGVDVHGLDYTNAAKRAVFDAIHHSSLGFPRLVGKTADDMRVEVTIGVRHARQHNIARVDRFAGYFLKAVDPMHIATRYRKGLLGFHA